MQRKMILAMDLDGCIGKDDGLPWRLRADMLRFKRLTIGDGNNAVLMGRTLGRVFQKHIDLLKID